MDNTDAIHEFGIPLSLPSPSRGAGKGGGDFAVCADFAEHRNLAEMADFEGFGEPVEKTPKSDKRRKQ